MFGVLGGEKLRQELKLNHQGTKVAMGYWEGFFPFPSILSNFLSAPSVVKNTVRVYPIFLPPNTPRIEEEMFEHEDSVTIDYTNRPYDDLTKKIIGAAIEVHEELGPGLLESAYETCLICELQRRGLKVEWQKAIPIEYKEVKLDCGYRLDLLVEEKIIIEIKSTSELTSIHEAQLITYLKLSGCKIGLLLNFNVKILKHGIRRLIV